MQRYQDYDYLFKIIIIGEKSSGKTSLLSRYIDQTFSEHLTSPHSGFKIFNTRLQNFDIKIQIWDELNGENRNYNPYNCYRAVHGCMITLDLTHLANLAITKDWIGEVLRYGLDSTKKILVGTKSDHPNRQITTEQAKALADEYDMSYIETSAKNDVEVKTAFETLTTHILQRFQLNHEQQRAHSFSTSSTHHHYLSKFSHPLSKLSTLFKRDVNADLPPKQAPSVHLEPSYPNPTAHFKVFSDIDKDTDLYPKEYICPLSLEIMHDPLRVTYLLDEKRFTKHYEKSFWEIYAAEFKLRHGELLDPISKIPINEKNVSEDLAFKVEIETYVKHMMEHFVLDVLDKYFFDERNFIIKDLDELKETFRIAVRKFTSQENFNPIEYFEWHLNGKYQEWYKNYSQLNYDHHSPLKSSMLAKASSLLNDFAWRYSVDFKLILELKKTAQEKKRQNANQDPILLLNQQFEQELKPKIDRVLASTIDNALASHLPTQKIHFSIRHKFVIQLIDCLRDHFAPQSLATFKTHLTRLNCLMEEHPSCAKEISVVQQLLIYSFLEVSVKKLGCENETLLYQDQPLKLMKFYEQVLRQLSLDTDEAISQSRQMLDCLCQALTTHEHRDFHQTIPFSMRSN